MRVLFTSQPGSGMFNPLVPFAQALVDAGHDVAVACAASFCPVVEAAGFRTFAAGVDWRNDSVMRTFPDAPPPGPTRIPWIYNLFRSTTPRAMVPDLLVIASEWRPDLIVHEYHEHGSYLAAELLGLPHAVAGAVWFRPQATLTPSLDPLRHELGLAPDPDGTRHYRYLALAPMPPAWIAPDEEPPPTVHFIHPQPLVSSGEHETLGLLADLAPDRPLVHATLGTTEVTQTPGLYEAIMAGLRDEAVNLVVGIGRQREPAEFGPQPSHVRIAHHVDHSVLLPRCDAVITHGGFGTMMGCLAAGVPMVVIPVQGDQPRNARRCADLGAGRVVGPDDRTPAAIRAAVRAVLTDPSYRHHAAGLQAELATLPGIEHAVMLLEQLAAERQPLRATPAADCSM